MLVETLQLYFDYWNKCDLYGLMSIFSKDIVLKDWEGSHQGSLAVLDVNSKIFKHQPDIKLKVIDTAVTNDNQIHLADMLTT